MDEKDYKQFKTVSVEFIHNEFIPDPDYTKFMLSLENQTITLNHQEFVDKCISTVRVKNALEKYIKTHESGLNHINANTELKDILKELCLGDLK